MFVFCLSYIIVEPRALAAQSRRCGLINNYLKTQQAADRFKCIEFWNLSIGRFADLSHFGFTLNNEALSNAPSGSHCWNLLVREDLLHDEVAHPLWQCTFCYEGCN